MTSGSNKILLTKQGFEEIQKEYNELLKNKRPRVVERLSEARRAGDLSENSEYTQSREELGFVDGRLEELKEVLDRAEIADISHGRCQQVSLGCQVTVQSSNNGEQVFHLVGEWEANPMAQKISSKSPIGKSLLGKKIGETVEIEAPAGKLAYKIVKID